MNQLKAQIEASVAAEIVQQFMGEDEETIWDVIRAGSNFEEMLRLANAEEQQAQADADAVGAIITTLGERKKRHESRSARLRGLIAELLSRTGLRKVELPEATIALAAARQSVVIADETALPDEYVRVKREPDKTAILKALQIGAVPGASLSNGGERLTIRRK